MSEFSEESIIQSFKQWRNSNGMTKSFFNCLEKIQKDFESQTLAISLGNYDNSTKISAIDRCIGSLSVINQILSFDETSLLFYCDKYNDVKEVNDNDM